MDTRTCLRAATITFDQVIRLPPSKTTSHCHYAPSERGLSILTSLSYQKTLFCTIICFKYCDCSMVEVYQTQNTYHLILPSSFEQDFLQPLPLRPAPVRVGPVRPGRASSPEDTVQHYYLQLALRLLDSVVPTW